MTYPTPLLMFVDSTGLDFERFNTIRLGGGWAKRLKKGDRVLLATKLEVIGSARVSDVHVGRMNVMLPLFAHKNHIELALRGRDPRYDASLAAERRIASARKMYGPQRVTDTANISVIELRR